MYLLYVDESGEPNDPTQKHFVMGGVAVFERQIYHLSQAIDNAQQFFFPNSTESIEFHASDIYRHNKEPWHSLSSNKRQEVLSHVYRIISESHSLGVVLFGIVVDKSMLTGEDVVYRTFEEMCNRFDLYLARLHDEDNEQRGIMILDESRYESRLKELLSSYQKTGTRFGTIFNIPECPVFTDSKVTRMLQIADFCSWAIYRRYEHGDSSHLDKIINKFDKVGNIIHGLVHITHNRNCTCTYCLTRKLTSP